MVFQFQSKSVLDLVLCLVNENSLNCSSALVLLCFLFRRQEFCYDHKTSQTLQICFFSFVHAFSTEVRA